jgi:hypothetical protein
MPPGERYITIDRLESMASIANGVVYEIAKTGRMSTTSRTRLARILEWVENDQIRVKRRPNRPTLISIEDPKPPQETITTVAMTARGPRVQFRAINPRAMPHRAKLTA